jgi:hypothetical protein
MHRQKPLSIALGLALIIGMNACAATKVTLTGNPDIPAAQGEVKLGTSENGNTTIDLQVKHLAPPEKVNPAATVFMVWVRPMDPGANPVSLGALQVNEKLEGRMSTVTPLRAFDLFVTAEPTQLSTGPTGKELFTAHVQMSKKE